MNFIKKIFALFLFISTPIITNAYGVTEFLNILHIPPHIDSECATKLIKASTAILPEFDSISHHVLKMNEILINKLLETQMDSDLRKSMILKVIEMTKQGDEMGGRILEDYYNLIDYLL